LGGEPAYPQRIFDKFGGLLRQFSEIKSHSKLVSHAIP